MANKRQKKKQQKKSLIERASQLGIQSKNLKFTDLLDTVTQIETKQQKTAHKSELQRIRREKAKQKLLDAGYKESEINSKMYSSMKTAEKWTELKKIEGKNKQLPAIDRIDWFAKRDISPNAFYIAFSDLTGEFTLAEILPPYLAMHPHDLIAELKRIRAVKPTYRRRKKGDGKGKKGTSSGKAGKSKYQFGRKDILKYNKRKKGWQTVNGGHWDVITIFKVTAVITAIMNHIVELERQPLYQNYYYDICQIEPLMKEVLE